MYFYEDMAVFLLFGISAACIFSANWIEAKIKNKYCAAVVFIVAILLIIASGVSPSNIAGAHSVERGAAMIASAIIWWVLLQKALVYSGLKSVARKKRKQAGMRPDIRR